MLQVQLLLVAGAPGLAREPGSLNEGLSVHSKDVDARPKTEDRHPSSVVRLLFAENALIVKARLGLYPRDELVKRRRTFVAFLTRANSHRPRLGFLRAGYEHVRNLLELRV